MQQSVSGIVYEVVTGQIEYSATLGEVPADQTVPLGKSALSASADGYRKIGIAVSYGPAFVCRWTVSIQFALARYSATRVNCLRPITLPLYYYKSIIA